MANFDLLPRPNIKILQIGDLDDGAPACGQRKMKFEKMNIKLKYVHFSNSLTA